MNETKAARDSIKDGLIGSNGANGSGSGIVSASLSSSQDGGMAKVDAAKGNNAGFDTSAVVGMDKKRDAGDEVIVTDVSRLVKKRKEV